LQRFFLFRSKARRLCLLLVAMIAVGLPVGCSVLAQKERELVFRIEPGNASWFSGLPRGVEELQLTHSTFGNQQNIHAWWWPAADADAPALLYLHGVRWNLTGHLFRLEQLRNLGFSVLAIDYRGFGQSLGELPSERSVYADARVGWERLKALQPDPDKRFIYGHSLGGAVAVDLAAELGEQAERGDSPPQARALIIESTFTSLADVATVVEKYLGDDVRTFLADHGLTPEDVSTWICHPGGPRVIEAVEKGLGLPGDALDHTRKSLRDNGNLSSVSVLDVLAANLADPPSAGSVGLMIAMGPAFCSELVLLRW